MGPSEGVAFDLQGTPWRHAIQTDPLALNETRNVHPIEAKKLMLQQRIEVRIFEPPCWSSAAITATQFTHDMTGIDI